jgi:hypothetical protein
MRIIFPLTVAAGIASTGAALADGTLPRHDVPVSTAGNLVVGLCDGESWIEVPGVKAGEPMSREQAQRVADTLMDAWRDKHPGADWVVAAAEAQDTPRDQPPTKDQPKGVVVGGSKTANPNAPAAPGAAAGGQVQAYGAFTERDRQIWRDSTEKLVAEGKRIFHDAKALGSTDAISCDMCHPDAANTHPETYPKYQVQLGRVALLRDMINWCIENPVRGKPLADDDPRLKALEAYIIAQRKGVPLDYGKH